MDFDSEDGQDETLQKHQYWKVGTVGLFKFKNSVTTKLFTASFFITGAMSNSCQAYTVPVRFAYHESRYKSYNEV